MANALQWLALAGFLFISYAAGVIGSFSTVAGIRPGWYETLTKPAWTPPSWVFSPVWTVLYTLMGIAAWLVWRTAGSWASARIPLALFVIQLMLNTAWSIVFFGQRDTTGGLMVIILLLFAIIATTVAFFRVNRVAGWLFIPYVLWVTYATTLNAGIVLLNR